jgi:hypothetical protein
MSNQPSAYNDRTKTPPIAAMQPGVSHASTPYMFTPDSDRYRAIQPIDVDPDLANDQRLKDDLQKLSRAFETSLASLQAAHQVAQQRLIAEARLRNQIPLDVNTLMEKAAIQYTSTDSAQKAMKDAVTVPTIRAVVESLGSGEKLERSFPATADTLRTPNTSSPEPTPETDVITVETPGSANNESSKLINEGPPRRSTAQDQQTDGSKESESSPLPKSNGTSPVAVRDPSTEESTVNDEQGETPEKEGITPEQPSYSDF